MSTNIVWLRNDLRLADHPALAAAHEAGAFLPVFVLDEEAAGRWRIGGASRWWLHGSLKALAEDFRKRGAMLTLKRGEARQIIPALARELGAASVFASRSHEPWLRAMDRDIAEALKTQGIAFHRYRSSLMFGPEEITTNSGGAYGVYAPFSRACFDKFAPRPPIPAPDRFEKAPKLESDRLDDWNLLPKHPDWAGGLRETWTPGEAGGQRQLAEFVKASLHDYDTGRNAPGAHNTSMLSPYLHWGELAIDTVWQAADGSERQPGNGVVTFLKELIWHEFSAYLLWHHPDFPDQPLRRQFAAMPWREAPAELRAWQRGMTGIPMVDAGMRQLWQIGWMHNRVRMVTASFLIKHLLLPWQEGEAWFWDTLVDADLAANSVSWQWVAGCGADAAPYFRIFNPVLQGEKFDPKGEYVRAYVPELAALPDKYIHAPWKAPARMLKQAGITLGETYPHPIVDLNEGRNRAMAALSTVRKAQLQ
jgi:deoxyribodipyrimidine photo-lyase